MTNGNWVYANSMLAAAIELARTPEAATNLALQDKICRKYGVFTDMMTDDEIHEFENLIRSFL